MFSTCHYTAKKAKKARSIWRAVVTAGVHGRTGRVPARGRENPYPFASLTHRGFQVGFLNLEG